MTAEAADLMFGIIRCWRMMSPKVTSISSQYSLERESGVREAKCGQFPLSCSNVAVSARERMTLT